MSMFNEANTVENLIRDTLVALGWQFIPGEQLPRSETDVLIESQLRDALIRLNPEIAQKPDRADEVIYKLRAILLSVSADGLARANEEFAAWLRGERQMPFGSNNDYTSVRLIDFENPENSKKKNLLIVSTQVTFRTVGECRFDLVLWVNGIPLIVGEAKTPVRPAVTWVDGAAQIRNDYEINFPAFFVPNVCSFASEGKTYRYGAIKMPLDLWAAWRTIIPDNLSGLAEVKAAVQGMLKPAVVLDILRYFTLFATDRKRQKIKIICRYQQYNAANQIIERVIGGQVRKGLIWHFQGSGKSLLMLFAAQKLRLHPTLKNPTVLIVVDRVDLDTQITAGTSHGNCG